MSFLVKSLRFKILDLILLSWAVGLISFLLVNNAGALWKGSVYMALFGVLAWGSDIVVQKFYWEKGFMPVFDFRVLIIFVLSGITFSIEYLKWTGSHWYWGALSMVFVYTLFSAYKMLGRFERFAIWFLIRVVAMFLLTTII